MLFLFLHHSRGFSCETTESYRLYLGTLPFKGHNNYELTNSEPHHVLQLKTY